MNQALIDEVARRLAAYPLYSQEDQVQIGTEGKRQFIITFYGISRTTVLTVGKS